MVSLFGFAATRVGRATATTDIVALACGDLAGSGRTEIVAVGRHKLQLGMPNASRFSVRKEASWGALSPVAPSPLREPIGAALIESGTGVFVGLTDRANAVAALKAAGTDARRACTGAFASLFDSYRALSHKDVPPSSHPFEELAGESP